MEIISDKTITKDKYTRIAIKLKTKPTISNTKINVKLKLPSNSKLKNIQFEKGNLLTDYRKSINNVDTRLKNAEQQITADAIINKVNSSLADGKQINSVSTTLDKTGFTVKNGAIKVQNKAGQDVMVGDTDGNLWVKNKFTIGGTADGKILVKNNADEIVTKIDKNKIYIKGGILEVSNGEIKWDEDWVYPFGGITKTVLLHNGVKSTFENRHGSQHSNGRSEYTTSGMLVEYDNRGTQNFDQPKIEATPRKIILQNRHENSRYCGTTDIRYGAIKIVSPSEGFWTDGADSEIVGRKALEVVGESKFDGNLTLGKGHRLVTANNYGILGTLSNGTNDYMMYMGTDDKIRIGYNSRPLVFQGRQEMLDITDHRRMINIQGGNGTSHDEMWVNMTNNSGKSRVSFTTGGNGNGLRTHIYDNNGKWLACHDLTATNMSLNGNSIVESGSNANGHYTKYYDGTLICSGSEYVGIALNTQWGNAWYGAVARTYPYQFYDLPKVMVSFASNELTYGCLSLNRTTGAFTTYVANSRRIDYKEGHIQYTAIGRWKA